MTKKNLIASVFFTYLKECQGCEAGIGERIGRTECKPVNPCATIASYRYKFIIAEIPEYYT